MHQDIKRIHSQIEPQSAGANHHHTSFLNTKDETGKVASPDCSNTMSTFLPLPVISQIALPKLTNFSKPRLVLVCVDGRQLSPRIVILASQHPFGAEAYHKFALNLIRDYSDSIAPCGVDQLDRIAAKPARGAPKKERSDPVSIRADDSQIKFDRRWPAKVYDKHFFIS